MNLQKTTQYALKVLSRMAMEGDQLFTADRLSEDTGIPKRYLRRLMTELSKAGFLKVSRGRNGGFSFARNASGITLFDIISFFETDSLTDQCILGCSFCILDAPCIMHEQWVEAQSHTLNILKKTTLGSLKDTYISQIIRNKK